MLWIFGGLTIGSILSYLYEGYKKKRMKYALKKSANVSWQFIVLVWLFYYFLGMVQLTAVITTWANQTHDAWTPTVASVMHYLPLAFVITVIYIAFRIVWSTKRLRYNEQEQQWERESQIKFRDKLPVFLRRFVKIKDAPKNV